MRQLGCSIVAMTSIVLGCSSSLDSSSAVDEARFAYLGRFYGEFMAAHSGKPPADEAQLVTFLKQSGPFLKSRGIADPHELLVSPRDRKPLVVFYDNQVIQDGPGGLPWIALESEGVNGKKYMIGARGTAEEMTQEQIEAITNH
jgi:hypothetical protein